MTPAVTLADVRKDFGEFTALSSVSFDIADNEFFTLLGPSGCGKTTLLRMIAGFENTTEGAIFLYGEEIETLPPDKRPINTVFQNYALFPHMSVAENIGFGLKMLKWKRGDIAERVEQMVRLVKLEEFVSRKPSQLSGGQQQRVALARAMAPGPKVLLLDEPLSALDLKLRQQMRAELKELQRSTGITFIFVTHDQEEALTMSDRIAVMSAGQLQQIGTPNEIYENPANRFVADFIGDTNLVEAVISTVNGNWLTCTMDGGEVVHALSNDAVRQGDNGFVSLRPERLTLWQEKPQGESLHATLIDSTYLGTDVQFAMRLSGGQVLSVRMQNNADQLTLALGDQAYIGVAEGAARFLVR